MRRKIHDDEKHAQFVTFSCYKRRTLLNPNQSKRIVIGTLGSRLAGQDGICIGFVVMPDHVHALIWFPETGQLSSFMNKWKELTSKAIKKLYREKFPNYWKKLDNEDPVWQQCRVRFADRDDSRTLWLRRTVRTADPTRLLNNGSQRKGTIVQTTGLRR